MKPLEHLLIVDLSRVLAGPYCTMTLGDLGARVIKIEEPGKGDDTRGWGPPFWHGESTYFLSLNRNKESLTLNLKSKEGKEILWRLIARGDVLVENFRPGTLRRLGFDWETMHEKNPRIIYCAISGYGQTGPQSHRPGYDLIAQGEGGVMSVTGEPDGPPHKAGVSQADVVAGMWSTIGILTALAAREKTGEGQMVDSSLIEGQLGLLTYQAYNYWSGHEPTRMGNRHPNLTPYETYAASDGHLNVGVGSEGLWKRFCEAMDAPELMERPELRTVRDRLENRASLEQELNPRFARRTVADWLERFGAAGVPCGKVRSVPEALSDPQVQARGMIRELPHPGIPGFKVVGLPVHLSTTPGEPLSAPPALGQHTEGVLTELGYGAADIEKLRAQGIV
jgi:crotonobetainyl-CoA:carnitine CoA-transferase CaiB-like acyl-CoA transferase